MASATKDLDDVVREFVLRCFERGEVTGAEAGRLLGVHRAKFSRLVGGGAARERYLGGVMTRARRAALQAAREEDLDLQRLDDVLSEAQSSGPVEMDCWIPLQYACTRCHGDFVDWQQFRRLVHGDDQYRFPTRCPKCASSAKPRIA